MQMNIPVKRYVEITGHTKREEKTTLFMNFKIHKTATVIMMPPTYEQYFTCTCIYPTRVVIQSAESCAGFMVCS